MKNLRNGALWGSTLVMRSRVGLDRLSEVLPSLVGKRIGLLAHPASVDHTLRHARHVLRDHKLTPSMLFGPEHGYGGEAQDMISVGDARDADGVPIRSLYGAEFSDLIPADADLRALDVLLIDLQDVGARYYTFVWTAVLAMRACARLGVRTVILDRPNPLGSAIEGAFPVSDVYLSFVGLEPVPIRHGLTLGQIATWRARVEKLPSEALHVVTADAADTKFGSSMFVYPSPNMPTLETVQVYPGGCLLEGTNLSEGRGTTKPFEVFGAPWLDGNRLAAEMHALGLPGFRARPLTFHPMFHKHAQTLCGGVQLHVTDAHAFRAVATYVAAIALCQRQAPEQFKFRTETYEFRSDVPALDLLLGSPAVREGMLEGESPLVLAEAASKVNYGIYDEILATLAQKSV
jgi:uncharacterized protein YbbC (DUF1343 family)